MKKGSSTLSFDLPQPHLSLGKMDDLFKDRFIKGDLSSEHNTFDETRIIYQIERRSQYTRKKGLEVVHLNHLKSLHFEFLHTDVRWRLSHQSSANNKNTSSMSRRSN